jgi:molybdopterin-guanine dinucleotide biosynthesis protein A
MGMPKACAELAGRRLIDWVLDALRKVSEHQIVVARQVDHMPPIGAQVVADVLASEGPLAGMHAGLLTSPTDLNLVVACDLPLVRPALLRLLAGVIGQAQAAIPRTSRTTGVARLPTGAPLEPAPRPAQRAGLQPLCAAYRRSCVAVIEDLVVAGPLPVASLRQCLETRLVQPAEWQPADPDGRSFLNLNTPDDLAWARTVLAEAGGAG